MDLDALKRAAISYQKIVDKDYYITFTNDKSITIQFKQNNFAHLAGLRKLIDLHFSSREYTASRIFKMILSDKISMDDIQTSRFFDMDAKERIENLCRLEELFKVDAYAVFGFQGRSAHIRTQLKSDVLFFKDDGYSFYLILGAAHKNALYYPETFFLRFDRGYIEGQNIVRIANVNVARAANRS